jgi:hypothetical protein
MLWLALWSALEPGLGIIATSLATLRPLVHTVSLTLDTWKSTGKNTSSQPRNTGMISDQSEPRKRPAEKGFSVLDETMDTMVETTDESFGGFKIPARLSTTAELGLPSLVRYDADYPRGTDTTKTRKDIMVEAANAIYGINDRISSCHARYPTRRYDVAKQIRSRD